MSTDTTFASELPRLARRAERISVRRGTDAASEAGRQPVAARRLEYLIVAGQLVALAILLPIVIVVGAQLPW